MIIREFRCCDCSATFESSDPVEDVVCPQCTAPEAERVFLTAPALKSPKTSSADRTLKTLAADYGMSDMSNRHGAAVKSTPPAGGAAPGFTEHNPQTAQVLARLGGNADSFSPVLPMLQRAGRPTQWQKVPEKR